MIEHDGCQGCKYDKSPSTNIYCQGCKQNAVDKYVKITNIDRIREMTDEELAVFLHEIFFRGMYNKIYSDYSDSVFISKERTIEWLKNEAW